jgi:amino acid adenylation domain-containing protein
MFALSAAQQVVWLHEQLHPGGSAYHFTAQLDLRGPLDEVVFAAALAAVVDRHAMFRTALVAGTDPPRQQTAPAVPTPLRIVDLPELSGPRWQALLDEHVNRPFDLTTPPLLRWTLIRIGPQQHRLLHTEHHLIHDGHSWVIVLRDLLTAYREGLDRRPIRLPAAPEYAEYVAAQASPAAAEARDRAIAGWRARLAGAPFGRTVPGTRRRAGHKRFVGAQFDQALDATLADRVRAVARRGRHTEFSVLFAVFAELARRYTGEPELVIGTTIANRPPELAGTVGMFVNAVPIRLQYAPHRPAHEHVGHTMWALVAGLEGAAAPIQDITREVGASGAGLDNPLFRLMFSGFEPSILDLDLGGLRVDVTVGLNLSISRLDIDVVVVLEDPMVIGARPAGPAGMRLLWDYDTDRYDQDFIALMAGRYARLLDGYTADPQRPLRDLPMVDPAEPAPATIGIGPPATARDNLFARYAAIAADRAEAAALIAGQHTISHRELIARADRLADRLVAAGVGTGSRVAVILPRSADAVAALLACLRLGAAFCPLTSADPPARQRALLDRLHPAAVVTDDAGLARHLGVGPPALSATGPAEASTEPAGTRPPPADEGGGERIAYIMHTSGSTGAPRPVAVSRASLANHVAAIQQEYGLSATDRALQFAEPSFDVFLEETLPTLLAGGTVVVAASAMPTGADLAALMTMRTVTVANLPTAYAAAVLADLAAALGSLPPLPLRLLVLGGERVSFDLANRMRAVLGDIDVVNAYGVTEATVTSSCYHWPSYAVPADKAAGTGDELPIGRPLAGIHLYVLDPDRRSVPAGIIGEIAIGGAGVALGYLDDATETARRFVPVNGAPGRCYLTGDLGYWRPDGQLCFVGRRDNQIKLNGFRIELEEVEAVAATVVGGARRAVILDESGAAPRLVGFVETGSMAPSAALSTEAIQAALAERLPPSMLPTRWIAVPQLPLLAGDKPDRARLAALIPPAAPPDESETGVYQRVRAVWAEVLGRDQLDAESDFFALGGHSLLAMQIVARLRQPFGDGIPLALVFEEPTLGRFAAALERITTVDGRTG